MTFEYVIELPQSITDERILTETVTALLAELTPVATSYAEVVLGKNYDTLDWQEGKLLSEEYSVVAAKMLCGGGSLACLNVDDDRPIYHWVTDSDLITDS